MSCRFRGLYILTDGLKMTGVFCIRYHWRFGRQTLLQMIENQYKVVYYSTYCVFVPRLRGV